MRVKDPPNPIASARGNVFPLEALSEIPAWMLAWHHLRRRWLPCHSAGSLDTPSPPFSLLLTYYCVGKYSQDKVVRPIYFANTESRCVEYFSSLLLILEVSSYVYLHCQAEIHRDVKLLLVVIALVLSATNYSSCLAFYTTFLCLQLPT